ncbi:MAG: hypothetical protein CVU61_11470 [Deltaproteobacteria bacterium HGW-Deltaproteobacteria-19]|jgi:hypothetical protein|nr:MAG: hypothetical protein CVU61_11470 [Deltaproteobacteria bacterium HGW-Deltaproteobacteria-19]
MASKAKGIRQSQKDIWQKKMEKRLAELAAKGIEGTAAARDAVVRALKAKVREANGRLAAIDAKDKKTADKKETKARKLEEAKLGKTKEDAPPVEEKASKSKKKKEEKAEKKEGAAKEKKPKAKV